MSKLTGDIVIEICDGDLRAIVQKAICVGAFEQHEIVEITLDEESGDARIVLIWGAR